MRRCSEKLLWRARSSWHCRCAARHAHDLASRPKLAADAIADWLNAQGYIIKGDGPSGGGDWSWRCTARLESADGSKEVYTKTQCKPLAELLLGEALGLKALHAAGGVRVPEVIHYDEVAREELPGHRHGMESFIITERLEPRDRNPDMYSFGRDLARTHLAGPLAAHAKSGKFGFDVDTSIGGPFESIVQPNGWMDDWPSFFRRRRMDHIMNLANDPDMKDMWQLVDKKTDGLKSLFSDGVEVRPATLHGDLWARTYGAMHDNTAVLFEPVAYYGHHEAEFGMAWCAGFDEDFWRGYRELIPEAPLFKKRVRLYEAYHKVCHWMWFRKQYKEQVLELLSSLC